MVYSQLWKFLPPAHPLRRSLVGTQAGSFISNTHAQLPSAAHAIEDARANGELQSTIDSIARQTGVNGLPEFCRLPYWDWQKGTLLEPMYILYNQGEDLTPQQASLSDFVENERFGASHTLCLYILSCLLLE
jgi:hypothetical protein